MIIILTSDSPLARGAILPIRRALSMNRHGLFTLKSNKLKQAVRACLH